MSARPRRPNLVLIICDALRADHLGCYGFPRSLTPNLDELARRGILFEDAVTTSPETAAAHASIMTGCYQTRHGIVETPSAISEDVETLAQICNTADYETGAVVSSPVILGPDFLTGIARGFSDYTALWPDSRRQQELVDAADTAALASDWLSRQSGRPFFLWVHFVEPHGPYRVADPALLELVRNLPRREGEPSALPVLVDNFDPGGIPPVQVMGDNRDPVSYRAHYAARVAYVDRYVGELLRRLRSEGFGETVVALTSDHGELLGEHDYYFQHCVTVFQPVLRVPLIISGPGVTAGRRLRSGVSHVDLMPTLLELLGLGKPSLPAQMHGRSLLPLLRNGEDVSPVPRYAMCKLTKEWYVLLGRYKYTRGDGTSGAPGRLIDLAADPQEEVDISGKEPTTAAKLGELLSRFIRTAPNLLSTPPRPPDDLHDEQKRQLEALGYL